MILKNKERIILTPGQKNSIFDAVEKGKAYAIIGDEMISLQIIPTIFKLERWYSQENQRLANSNKRLCRFCFSSMDVMAGCVCWPKNGGVKQDAIEGVKLPSWILEKFGNFPELNGPSLNELEEKEDFLMIEDYEG